MRKLSIFATICFFISLCAHVEAQENNQPVQNKKTQSKKNISSQEVEISSSLIGTWEVWIAGAVTYTATETAVYQQYSPGAAMNRLEIQKNGAYQWGAKKGRLKEVRPWHAQEGRKYYQLLHANGNDYDFWYDESQDKLVVLFGDVGGHAATGNRLNAPPPIANPAEASAKGSSGLKGNSQTSSGGKVLITPFKKGDKVEIQWHGQWFKGIISETRDGEYKVSYDGWGAAYDEWVKPSRIRAMKN